MSIQDDNNKIEYFDNETQKENGQIVNNEGMDENDEVDENGVIDEIEEEKDKIVDNKNNNKEESQLLNNEDENQGKIERLFIYLRTGFIWRPIPTIFTTMLCLEITGAIFLLIGLIIVFTSKNIKEIEIRYDNNDNCTIGNECKIDFHIEETMEKNVFVYYRLKNFYQNHRRYIKSKSHKQLKGNILTEKEIKDDCDPIILNKDIYLGLKNIDNNEELDPNGVAHPCGLIAKSYFNDSYIIVKQGGDEDIIISDTDIAWSVDKDRYKNSDNKSVQWFNVENERFMVWMRPAAMPDFRKPWGRIERDLVKGDYTVIITNNYPVKSFDGKKYFILSTVSRLGGKNYFLGILYLVVGGVSIMVGILFWFGYKKYNIEKTQKTD